MSEILREPNKDGSEDETLINRLRRVHSNLGHPSNALLTRILKEAKAPDVVIDAIKDINFETCERLRRIAPARPSNAMKARRTGEYLAVDMSYHITPDGQRFMLANFRDEASRLHTAKVIKQAYVPRDCDLGGGGVFWVIVS